MKDIKKTAIKLLADSVEIKVDLKKLAHGLIDDALEPALRQVVADTKNPFDDMLLVAVYPSLEAHLKKLIDKKVEELEAELKKKIDELKA
jgi:hypothetical protein